MKKLGEIFLIKLVKFEKSWRIKGGGGPLKNKGGGGFAPPKGGPCSTMNCALSVPRKITNMPHSLYNETQVQRKFRNSFT